MTDPWHGVSYGSESPEVVRSIIEIPDGSRAKYEIDKESGLLIMDRVLYSSMHYPANYGYIPQTYCEDGDPLDILVLSQVKIYPLCLVNARVIGVMHMVDGGESDDKIIAVAADDIKMAHIKELSDLPQHTLDEIQNFFEDYKKLENKEVEIQSFQDRQTAYKVIEESIELYNKEFPKN